MKDKLKESENDHETYENFDTDDDTPKVKKKNAKYLFPIILFLLLITLITYLLYNPPKETINSNGNNKRYELTTKCQTTIENKKECKTYNPGDKLQDGNCLLNHSFKAIYHTDSPMKK